MQHETNHLGLPIGHALVNWTPPSTPARSPLQGRYCRIEPLDFAAHARALHQANALDSEGRMWTYLPYGPFDSFASYSAWLTSACASQDPMFFAIIDLQLDQALGVAAYSRIDLSNGAIEVGHLAYSPRLQRTRAASEAMYLMMQQVFDLGYRRYEWKCNALNAASRQAAQRLGFSFEGIFRQARVVKGRSRDTAWYSVIDSEWPTLQSAYQRWLDPANFDERQQQRVTLSSLLSTAYC